MLKSRLIALFILAASVGLAYFLYTSEVNEEARFPFKYGLDLQGGTHLVYTADVSNIEQREIARSMDALRDLIERRVNLFGVAEPLVQVERGGLLGVEERLIVELPGVTDVDEAVALIGRTPELDFRLLRDDAPGQEVELDVRDMVEGLALDEETEGTTGEGLDLETELELTMDDFFVRTGLTGRFVQRATLEFDNVTSEPKVVLTFNQEGRELFAEITRENVGEMLAIFLDGVPISTPVIREEIRDGSAVISGGFTPQEARDLVRDLNFGALPVPIALASTQSVGATLGEEVLDAGVMAGITGLILVALFLILWYRLPGLIAIVALATYIIIMLSIFKLIPVTLTAAGIAGFILSIGMAVDANILVFERLKEELKSGKRLTESIADGFSRAWPSIRDGNISSIITAIILFWFGTSMVQGFALVFGIGVLVSMLSALTITRTLLLAVTVDTVGREGASGYLFGSGLTPKPEATHGIGSSKS
jgi:preprotein translocase subunit SecD